MGNTRDRKKQLTPRERAKKQRRNLILIALEVIVLGALLVVCFMLGGFFDTFGKEKTPFTPPPQDEDGKIAGVTEKIENIMTDETVEDPMKDYNLIALFGVDSRNENLSKGDNRSDTIMIAAIHKETKDVKLVSVYRDTLLNVNVNKPSYKKCNSAYALGSYTQAVAMLNANLDLYIEDYITIGFKGLTDTVDALGGIYLTIEEAEIQHLNNYQMMMSKELGADDYPYVPVEEAGYQKVTGLQATAYCRIRATKGSDFRRTERQRDTLEAILERAKSASVSELTDAAKSLVYEVSTSLTMDEILAMVEAVSEYNITETGGFPEASMRSAGTLGNSLGSCVVPDNLAANVVWLHEFIFEDTEYEVSDTVLEYGREIYNIASPYLGDYLKNKVE